MPILPLDHLEPFAATIGVMLYPGLARAEHRKAKACAAKIVSYASWRYGVAEANERLSREHIWRLNLEIIGAETRDVDERLFRGSIAGELLKAYFVLSEQNPAVASWENAIRIMERTTARDQARGSRTLCREALRDFKSVAHLWAAWTLRDRQFITDHTTGYDGWTDFQFLLAEAEILRDWGQHWRPPRAKAPTPLPEDVWRVPEAWRPPDRQPGWPMTGAIPCMTLPGTLIAGLRPAGRPRASL